MKRIPALFFAALVALFAGVSEAPAQAAPQWSPPSRDMPAMPSMAALQGDWLSTLGPWFRGVEQVSGVSPTRLRAMGDAKPGSDRAQLVRFSSGPVPVAVWSDRNGDGRLDLLELYRTGAVVIQLIDADYDGQANVMRILDASGTLIREERLHR